MRIFGFEAPQPFYFFEFVFSRCISRSVDFGARYTLLQVQPSFSHGYHSFVQSLHYAARLQANHHFLLSLALVLVDPSALDASFTTTAIDTLA